MTDKKQRVKSERGTGGKQIFRRPFYAFYPYGIHSVMLYQKCKKIPKGKAL